MPTEQVVVHEREQQRRQIENIVARAKERLGLVEGNVPTDAPWRERWIERTGGYEARLGREAAELPTLPAGWNQLSQTEKYLYQNVFPSKPARFLTEASEYVEEHLPWLAKGIGYAGKALGFFDLLAEGTERLAGTVSQYNEAAKRGETDRFFSEFSAAWKAASFYYDASNTSLFALTPRDIDEEGHVTIYHDLPGYQELSRYRQMFLEGSTREEIAAQIQGEAGPLGLRMAMQDAFGHIVADPGNIVFPRIFKIPSNLILKRGEILYKTGAYTDDVIDAARVAEKAAFETMDAARIASRPLDEAAVMVQDAIRASEYVAELEGRALSPWQKFVVNITGGVPQSMEAAAEWVAKGPRGLNKVILPWNWFRLTPQSRAVETLERISLNVQSVLNRTTSVDEAVDLMRAVVNGADNPQIAHIVASAQGRAVQSWLRGAGGVVDDMHGFWLDNAGRRGNIEAIARLLSQASEGEYDIHRVMDKLINGEHSVVWDDLVRALDAAPGEGLQVQHALLNELRMSGALTDEVLGAYGKLFKNVPYDQGTFMLHLQGQILEWSAKQAIAKYGVEAASWWRRASEALKSAESLIFLRLNPKYPIINFLNNEITGIARGTWNMMRADDIVAFWKRVGVVPPRLTQGVGMAGIGGIEESAEQAFDGLMKAYGQASGLIAEATEMNAGWLGRFADKVKGIKLPADAGSLAQQVERSASMRFMTQGMVEGMKWYWRPGRGYDLLSNFNPTLAQRLGDQVVGDLHRMIQANPYDFAEKLAAGSAMNRTTRHVFEEAANRLGIPIERIDEVFGPEISERIASVLDPALQTGRADDVRGAVQLMRRDVANHIDDWIGSADPGELLADGPNGVMRVYGELNAQYWDMFEGHLKVLDERIPNIRRLAPEEQSVMWDSLLSEQNASWTRLFEWRKKRVNAMLGAMDEQGIADVAFTDGRKLPEVIQGAIDAETAEIRGFHTLRQRLYRDHRKAQAAKKFVDETAEAAAWRKIEERLRGEYTGLIDAQDTAQRTLDEAIEALVPRPQRDAFHNWRVVSRQARREYMEWNNRFYEEASRLRGSSRRAYFAEKYAPTRGKYVQDLHRMDRLGLLAMSGDRRAADELARMSRGLLAAVEEELAVAEEVAEEAVQLALELAPGPTLDRPFFVDQRIIEKGQPPLPQTANAVYYSEGGGILDGIEQSSLEIIKRRKFTLADLAPEDEARVLNYIDHVGTQAQGTRLAAMNYAAARRDSALLNYTKRTELDSFLNTIAPYSFWPMHSLWNWGLWSLERPAVLANYLRLRRLYDTAGGSRDIPTRLRRYGMVPIKMPFWEDWMGEGLFINPLRIGLPIETFAYPFERYYQNATSLERNTARTLEKMLAEGEISQDEYAHAMQARSGPIWRMARQQARADGDDDSWFDFASMLVSPHAPLMWAYRRAFKPDEPWAPTTLMPITRDIKSITGYLGVGPPGGVNIEANIRRSLGLPEFDEWDTYRTERMLSNMAASNEITSSEAIQAMIDGKGPLWEEAERRAGKEYGLRGTFGIFGIPVNAYPPGEEAARGSLETFSETIEAYQQGDTDAYTRFFEEHPEAKARLALFDPPEERHRRFLIDELWSTYNELPKLHRDQLREALGEDFDNVFLGGDRDTYAQVPLEILQMWNRVARGDPVGTLSGDVISLEYANRDVAQRLQVFYDTRFQYFGDEIWDTQERYFMLAKGGARRSYLEKHPELAEYWEWRKDFIYRNPDIAPYIEEDPDKLPLYPSEAELERVLGQAPYYTLGEWNTILGPPLYNLALDYAVEGDDLPAVAQRRLDEAAFELGLSGWRDIADRLEYAIELANP